MAWYFFGWDKPVIDLGVKPFLLAEFLKIAFSIVTVYNHKLDILKKWI